MGLKRARETGRRVDEGAWIAVNEEAFPELAGVTLHVRGLNNNDFNRLQTKLTANSKRLSNGGDGVEHVLDECLVETIVLDWKGLKETDDDPDIPFSKETLRELLENKHVRVVLRPAIVHAATEVRAEEQKAIEADAKN